MHNAHAKHNILTRDTPCKQLPLHVQLFVSVRGDVHIKLGKRECIAIVKLNWSRRTILINN